MNWWSFVIWIVVGIATSVALGNLWGMLRIIVSRLDEIQVYIKCIKNLMEEDFELQGRADALGMHGSPSAAAFKAHPSPLDALAIPQPKRRQRAKSGSAELKKIRSQQMKERWRKLREESGPDAQFGPVNKKSQERTEDPPSGD